MDSPIDGLSGLRGEAGAMAEPMTFARGWILLDGNIADKGSLYARSVCCVSWFALAC